MNTNSMPTPEPESSGNCSQAKTPEQKTVAYWWERVAQMGVLPIFGLGIFLGILSCLAYRLLEGVNSELIVSGTLSFIGLVGLTALISWCVSGSEPDVNHQPTEARSETCSSTHGPTAERFPSTMNNHQTIKAPAPALPQGQHFWNDWKFMIAIVIFARSAMPPLISRLAHTAGTSQRSPVPSQPAVAEVEWPRRRQAALVYWQTAVAGLHQDRFQTPAGEEAAGELLAQSIQRFSKRKELAKFAPTVDVDQDLVEMAHRHAIIDEQVIQITADLDEMIRRENLPTDSASVGQRTKEWRNIVARIQAEPALLDDLPVCPERTLLENVMELGRQQWEQLREIETMQAVLQERYRGTKFPIPELGP